MNDEIDDFLDYLMLEKRLSENTKISYQFDLKDFREYFNNKKITDLKESDIINYLEYLSNKKKLTPRSIERHLTTIKGFFKYLQSVKKSLSWPCNYNRCDSWFSRRDGKRI